MYFTVFVSIKCQKWTQKWVQLIWMFYLIYFFRYYLSVPFSFIKFNFPFYNRHYVIFFYLIFIAVVVKTTTLNLFNCCCRPDDYEPERIDGQQSVGGRVAKISPGEDGILRLQLSNVDTFDNRWRFRLFNNFLS